jgi:5-methylcytosine-specific restriction endonuclease McrA
MSLTRHQPLKALTPLKRGQGLKRRHGLDRGTTRLDRNAPARPRAATSRPITPNLRAALWIRSGGLCEACGLLLPEKGWHAHHRLRVAHGRLDTLPNLVALHPLCHVNAPQAVHQRTGWAQDRGLLVKSTDDPVLMPLTLPDGRRVWLSGDGRYLNEPPTVAA